VQNNLAAFSNETGRNLEKIVPRYAKCRQQLRRWLAFAFVREKLKASYSDIGRPSIDPELLLRILLIGYLYGITSERKLVEELRMHLAWRWFTGLGFDQEIPHHSTFSKNWHGRFQESKLFEELFEQIVRQCVEVGLVQGKHLSVDGSFVEANAAKESRIPREQLGEAAEVNQTVRQYLVELEQQNPTEEPAHQQDQVSTTDPESRMPEQSPQRERMNTIVWATRSTSLRGQLEHGSATVAQKAASSSAAKPHRAVEIAGRSQDRAERVESIRATVLAFKIVKVG